MRRIALAALLGALLCCGASTAAVNPQIAGLQVALSAHRDYLGPVDGIAGSGTAAAVRSFQRESGLPVDGLAGPQTRGALGKLGRHLFGSRLIKRGMEGWDVSVLQFLLLRHGLPTGGIDGRFGPQTLTAVRRFQRARHLIPDGVVGRMTAGRLCPAPGCSSLRASRQGHTIYVVRSGDTLTSVAERFGTSAGAVAQANGIALDATLVIGRRLTLPVLPATPEATGGPAVSAGRIKASVTYWALHYGVDPHLARAVAWQESGYQSHIRSSIGAWGAMQVTPETWDYVESVLVQHPVPHTAFGNVRVGVAYLNELLREFDGNEFLAVAAYYQGPRDMLQNGIRPESRQYADNVLALKSRV
jgi:lysozyme family protein